MNSCAGGGGEAWQAMMMSPVSAGHSTGNL